MSAQFIGDARRRTAFGCACAIVAVLITSAYPALTRMSVTSSLAPGDLLAFRFGIGALIFAPMLIVRFRRITREEWRLALPLSFCQGWGMAALVVFGLQLGPASHAAALGPGAIAAWVAIVAFVVYGIRVGPRKLLGIAAIAGGVMLIVVASYRELSVETAITGDAMFVAASALGAVYLVTVERRRLDPVVSAALVCTFSAAVVVPWHFVLGASAIASATAREIAWQMLFQGVLFGGVSFIAVNYAIRCIGSQNVGIVTAIVPAIGAVCSVAIAGDSISGVEWVAIAIISIGVVIASLPTRADRPRTKLLLTPRMAGPMSGHTRAG